MAASVVAVFCGRIGVGAWIICVVQATPHFSPTLLAGQTSLVMNRIFVDGRLFVYSGIGRCIRNHLCLLRDFGVQAIVGLRSPDDGWLLRRLIDGPTDHIETCIHRPSVHLPWQFLRRPRIPGKPVDAYWFPQYAAAPFWLPPRSVVTVHDLLQIRANGPSGGEASWRSRGRALFARIALAQICNRAARVVCVSQETKDQLLLFSSAAGPRAVVVEHGMMRRGLPLLTRAQRRTMRESLGLTQFLLIVGIKERRKNRRFLLDLLSLLPPKISIVLAGEQARRRGKADELEWDQELAAWRSLHPHLSRRLVDFGEVSEFQLWRLYSSATALLLPSTAEGFGLTPLEALECRTPVLVSRGVPSARYADPAIIPLAISDVGAWAAAVVELLEAEADAPDPTPAPPSLRSWREATSELVDVLREASAL
jgi:glycosyltransferase involved in cell wall biosynthesis